jgi:hypothetical protein
MNTTHLQAPTDVFMSNPGDQLLGPDIHVIERDGLRVLRISRASWHRRVIHEVVLGPGRLELAMGGA